MTIDINCDMGEGLANDEQLMNYITSANIACGYHAGDEETMNKTIALCLKYNVAIGAHPSFPDREHFGRREMQLTDEALSVIIRDQVVHLQNMAAAHNTTLRHVKPHGALYNMAAKNKHLAQLIASVIRDVDEDLVLVGLSGSYLISEAKALGLKTMSEVFADRTYQDDGNLTNRALPDALITDAGKALKQVQEMFLKGVVTTVTGKQIAVVAETVCIHGDGTNAIRIAKEINSAFQQHT